MTLPSSNFLPPWALALIALAIGGGLALGLAAVLLRGLRRLAGRRGPLATAMVAHIAGPARLVALLLGLALGAGLAPVPPGFRVGLGHVLQLGVIGLIGWSALEGLRVGASVYGRRYRANAADNQLARKHLTQIQILERTAATLIGLVTVAAGLMTFPAVRQYGVTLLASAGAAGIIAGLALQPLLTNLIAGIQIAMTQPIRLDDAVIVEDEWGQVEEIGPTYVVLRLWDWRRLVVPLSYFIQKPFQNWTRESASLIGAAMIPVDFSAPIERMREKLAEIVEASPLWDGQVVNLAVTDLTERTMQVRCLQSARNAGDAFDLRCFVRERMIAFLRDEYPQALPGARLRLEGGDSLVDVPAALRTAGHA